MALIKVFAITLFAFAILAAIIEGCERFDRECDRRFGVKFLTTFGFAYWGLAAVLFWYGWPDNAQPGLSDNAALALTVGAFMTVGAAVRNCLRTNLIFGLGGTAVIGVLGSTIGPFLIAYYILLPFTAGNMKVNEKDNKLKS